MDRVGLNSQSNISLSPLGEDTSVTESKTSNVNNNNNSTGSIQPAVDSATFNTSLLSAPPELEKPNTKAMSSTEHNKNLAVASQSLGELMALIVSLLAKMKKDNANVSFAAKMANVDSLKADAKEIKQKAVEAFVYKIVSCAINLVFSVASFAMSAKNATNYAKSVGPDLGKSMDKIALETLNTQTSQASSKANMIGTIGGTVGGVFQALADNVETQKNITLKQNEAQREEKEAYIKALEESMTNIQDSIKQAIDTLRAISEEESKTLRSIAG